MLVHLVPGTAASLPLSKSAGFGRKHKHVVGFSLCVPSSMRQWYLLIILGLERYSCRFLSINCSFFLLLSLQGYSEMPESTLDTVYFTLLGQVGLSSPSRVRETKKRKWPKKTNKKIPTSCFSLFCIYRNAADSAVMPGHDSSLQTLPLVRWQQGRFASWLPPPWISRKRFVSFSDSARISRQVQNGL